MLNKNEQCRNKLGNATKGTSVYISVGALVFLSASPLPHLHAGKTKASNIFQRMLTCTRND